MNNLVRTWCAVVALCLAGAATGQDAAELEQRRQEFEVADARLNAVYQQARELLPEQVFIALRDLQREWLEGRDQRARDLASFNRPVVDSSFPMRAGGPPVETWPEFWEARRSLTEARTEFVRGWVQAYDGTFAGLGLWEGVWTDGYGGSLRLLAAGDGVLLLDMEVVRGPTFHTGQVSGRGTIREPGAVFSWQVPGESPAAGLMLRRLGPVAVVETSGPIDYFLGARAYFDGSYVRVSGLSPLQRLELLEITD